MKRMEKHRLLCGFLALVLVGGMLTSCSSADKGGEAGYGVPQSAYEADITEYELYDMPMAEEAVPVDDTMNVVTGGGGESAVRVERSSAATERKIITTVNLQMESTEYDSCVNDLYRAIQEAGGYIEYSDITGGVDANIGASGVSSHWNGAVTPLAAVPDSYYYSGDRSLYLSIRIPEENLPAFIARAESLGNVLSKQESAEDITLQYVDVESRITSLKTEREQLMVLLEQCDNIEDMILLQDRLSYVRYQIESYESQLRVMQNQVSYSTVNLRLGEVVLYTEKQELNPSIGQRISSGFSRSVREIKGFGADLVVWLAVNSIYLVVLAAVVVVAAILLRRSLRKLPKLEKKTLPGSGSQQAVDKPGSPE